MFMYMQMDVHNPSKEQNVLRAILPLHLTLQGSKQLGCLLIFLCNAKPSCEIAKWMAKHMLWQNMKINKIMQTT